MRLWTLHPRHLDPAGLVALWREALLAQAVLRGQTRGYTRHPQLERFRAAADPLAAISSYLLTVQREAAVRGYDFRSARIAAAPPVARRIPETRGQLDFEWEHFRRKVARRNRAWHVAHCRGVEPTPHPLFRITAGGVRSWERVG
jgi:hypothetical protein